MKYILLILLSLFMCVGNVSASKEEIYPGDEIRGAYVRVNSQDLKVTFNYDVNEKLIYLNNVDDVVNEVTDEEWDLIQKIMYYGYGYGQHTAQKWYVITQMEIWKVLYGTDNVNYIDKIGGVSVSKYEEEVQELNDLITKHGLGPDFGTDLVLDLNKKNTFIDMNGVLDGFEFNEVDGTKMSIDNNELEITTNSRDDFRLVLSKINDGYESIGVKTNYYFIPGNLDSITYEYEFITRYGDLNINLSIEDVLCESCNDAVYGIYLDGSLICEFSINDELNFYLGEGIYEIKQLSRDVGFVKDVNIYEVEVINNDVVFLDLEVKKITNEVNISKYNYKILDNDSVFELYDSKMNKLMDIEIEDGQYLLKLGYGDYTLKHVKNDEKYTLVDDVLIKVRTDGLIQNKNLTSELVSVVEIPDTAKYHYFMNVFLMILGPIFCKKWLK